MLTIPFIVGTLWYTIGVKIVLDPYKGVIKYQYFMGVGVSIFLVSVHPMLQAVYSIDTVITVTGFLQTRLGLVLPIIALQGLIPFGSVQSIITLLILGIFTLAATK